MVREMGDGSGTVVNVLLADTGGLAGTVTASDGGCPVAAALLTLTDQVFGWQHRRRASVAEASVDTRFVATGAPFLSRPTHITRLGRGCSRPHASGE
jgi:hypothetical protein